jgi:alpha-L-rhamnosidase
MILSEKFICSGETYSTFECRVPAPLFHKSINISGGIKKAEITVCGLGFYELYLNGVSITKGRLCPYITNSEQVLYYDNYDITELIKEHNSFEFLLGNGMQNAFGGFIWDFEKQSTVLFSETCFAV